ncbi:MAG: AAA family ATPase [Gammaproteobacteria bacterium]
MANADIVGLRQTLAAVGYIADDDLAAAIYLARELSRPLLLEGEAGAGKTAVAQALAQAAGAELIRLQCYEGLDAQNTLYEWNYQKQLLAIRLGEATTMQSVFSADYLLERPLLAAIRRAQSPVLLVDEVDRADEEFEAYLLEVLSDYQVSVPELGVVKAQSIPITMLTSNATRALSDALRRRCLYYYLDYPSEEKECAIVVARYPDIDQQLAVQAAKFVRLLRGEDLEKKPGVAETLDWVAALMRLKINHLETAVKSQELYITLSCLLKTTADRQAIPPQKAALLAARV